MAYGTVSSGSGSNASPTTSHTVSLPPSHPASSTIVIVVRFDDRMVIPTTPAGYTSRFIGLSANGAVYAYSKKTSGIEPPTISITTDSSCRSLYTTCSLTESDFYAVSAPSVGTTNPAVYPSVGSPVSGQRHFFNWVALDDTASIAAYPSLFTLGRQDLSGATSGHLGQGIYAAGTASSPSGSGADWPIFASDWVCFGICLTEEGGSVIEETLMTGEFEVDSGPHKIEETYSLPRGDIEVTGFTLENQGEINLPTGGIEVELFLIEDPAIINLFTGAVNLGAGNLNLSEDQEMLETGGIEITAPSILGCLNLFKNEITPIDMSDRAVDLCVLPPVDPLNSHGDYFGCIIVESNGAGGHITYGFDIVGDLPPSLQQSGDYIMFRRLFNKYFVWSVKTGSQSFQEWNKQ